MCLHQAHEDAVQGRSNRRGLHEERVAVVAGGEHSAYGGDMSPNPGEAPVDL